MTANMKSKVKNLTTYKLNQLPQYEHISTQNEAPGRVPLTAPPGAPDFQLANKPNRPALTLKCGP